MSSCGRLCRRRSSGLFQRAGAALGQPRLQLGRPSPVRLSLVHQIALRSQSDPCGRDSPRSFPRLHGGLARSSRSADRAIRKVGAGPRRRVSAGGREGLGQPAVYRRGPGNDHAGRLCPAGSISSSRHAGLAIRLRRSCGQSISTGKLRDQHGGLHGHARQSHHSGVV